MTEVIISGGIIVVIALLTLAVAWGTVLTRQKNMKEDIGDIVKKREQHLKEYLTEKAHVQLCKNSTLRFENHVTKVVNAMGDTLVGKIETIINGGK